MILNYIKCETDAAVFQRMRIRETWPMHSMYNQSHVSCVFGRDLQCKILYENNMYNSALSRKICYLFFVRLTFDLFKIVFLPLYLTFSWTFLKVDIILCIQKVSSFIDDVNFSTFSYDVAMLFDLFSIPRKNCIFPFYVFPRNRILLFVK